MVNITRLCPESFSRKGHIYLRVVGAVNMINMVEILSLDPIVERLRVYQRENRKTYKYLEGKKSQ